ncbi:MAG: radical SAM family heme chaperone HemW [Pyrinomonadaceae bacterium]
MDRAGIYIHIPFCQSRCSYCDFATGLYETENAKRYVDAVLSEINARDYDTKVDTIYFGGGTPSLLSPSQAERLLATVHHRFAVVSDCEITMEINPGSITPQVLREFRSLGINRASFGAQTFDDGELSRLGRSHSSNEIFQTFHELRAAGFSNVSFDLIAGLPGQSIELWQCNVEKALTLQPQHLSFYLLEVHSDTPLAEHIRTGKQPVPDEDLAALMYEWMVDQAKFAGYQHYEISNLCQPGFASRHNLKYWTGAPYFGFGCSAHSYDARARRWSNERDVNKYVTLIENESCAVVEERALTVEDVRAEAMFLGLRLLSGINLREYEREFGIDIRASHGPDLDRFFEAGLIEFEGDLMRLTRAGALLSNEVFAAFV